MPILLCDGTDLSLSQNQNVGGSSCSFVILRNCPKSKTFPNFCAKSLISLFLQSSSNIAHGFMLTWNISLLQQPGLGCRTYYVSLRRPARPPWPHWGCPPPAGRWNKVPPLLACSNLTRSALYYHNLLLHRVVHQVGLHHLTAFCLSLSLSPVWLVALKAGHQVEPTSVSQPETWCLQWKSATRLTDQITSYGKRKRKANIKWCHSL